MKLLEEKNDGPSFLAWGISLFGQLRTNSGHTASYCYWASKIQHTCTMSLLEPPSEILSLLREVLPDSVTSQSDETSGSEEILSYVAFLAAGLCQVQDFTPVAWTESLKPYLEDLENCGDGDIVDKFREAAEKAVMGEDDNDSYGDEADDGFEEVCNIRFK